MRTFSCANTKTANYCFQKLPTHTQHVSFPSSLFHHFAHWKNRKRTRKRRRRSPRRRSPRSKWSLSIFFSCPALASVRDDGGLPIDFDWVDAVLGAVYMCTQYNVRVRFMFASINKDHDQNKKYNLVFINTTHMRTCKMWFSTGKTHTH